MHRRCDLKSRNIFQAVRLKKLSLFHLSKRRLSGSCSYMVLTWMISDDKGLLNRAGGGTEDPLATSRSWKEEEKVTNEMCVFK